ncbi:MAG: ribosome biogenesis GTPase Der [Myxococcota bacterium]
MSGKSTSGAGPVTVHSSVVRKRRLPVVAVVGRPNVGKSTFFNRMTGRRRALTYNRPGVTRDRHYAEVDYLGRPFILIDTGGFDPDADVSDVFRQVKQQALLAVEEADVCVVFFDGREGVMPGDKDIVNLLRAYEKPTIYVVNKCDNDRVEAEAYDFYRLGMDELIPVSIEQGRGGDKILDQLMTLLPPWNPAEEEEDAEKLDEASLEAQAEAGAKLLHQRGWEPVEESEEGEDSDDDLEDSDDDLEDSDDDLEDSDDNLEDSDDNLEDSDDNLEDSDDDLEDSDDDPEDSDDDPEDSDDDPEDSDDEFDVYAEDDEAVTDDDDGPTDDTKRSPVRGRKAEPSWVRAWADGEERQDGNPTPSEYDEELSKLPPMRRVEAAVVPRIALVGRPNVGKSSLANKILGYERQVIHPEAGTTRDAIDIPFEVDGRSYVLVDTAGVRRKARISDKLEAYTVIKSLHAIEEADLVLLLIDAREGVTSQEKRLAGIIEEKGKGVIIIVNKWDLIKGVERQVFAQQVIQELEHIRYAPVHFISARTGMGIKGILPLVQRVSDELGREVNTRKLNLFLKEATEAHHHPLHLGNLLKLYYGVQVRNRPPTFMFYSNAPQGVRPDYKRYLENRLRATFGFVGAPVHLIFRARTR